jgi:hypothetical protein
MVDRSLSMREVRGSMPCASISCKVAYFWDFTFFSGWDY